MAVIECSRCGGKLEINADMSVGTCMFCGSVITIPKSVEKIGNLYNRANFLRRSNEWDKAEEIFEEILKEDNTDAEAHWGILMCRYGIEYVEDPESGERVPTCHRTERDSIYTQPSYLAAMEYADEQMKEVYLDQAQRIDKIQQKILKIANREEPYDVFICYKQTDDHSGERTRDSFIGEDLYYELTKAGYKVFFAQQSLRPGTDYEPYIFSALYTSKALIVIATTSEYANAVWVRNEWSRFLAMMKKDSDKMIIPVYKDMSPYDLPKELGRFHALDVSRIGFLQDIRDGINRIIRKPQEAETAKASDSSQSGTDAYLKRAYLFLEDGDTDSAQSYFNKVLDRNPEEAQAYWGLMLLDFNCQTTNEIASCSVDLSKNSNFQKALRFGTDAQANEYTSVQKQCNDNIRRDTEEKERQDRLAREKEARRRAYHRDFDALKKKYQEHDETKDALFLQWKKLDEQTIAAKKEYDESGGIKKFNQKVFWISLSIMIICFLINYAVKNPHILNSRVVSGIAVVVIAIPLMILAGALIYLILSIFIDDLGCFSWAVIIIGGFYGGSMVVALLGQWFTKYVYSGKSYHLIPVIVCVALIAWQVIRVITNKTMRQREAALYNEYCNKKAISDKEWNNIQQRAFEELTILNEKNEEFSGELHTESEIFEEFP